MQWLQRVGLPAIKQAIPSKLKAPLKRALRPFRSKRYTKYDGGNDIHWQWYSDPTHWYHTIVDETLAYLDAPGTVLDVGSGDGLVESLLVRRGFTVTGIEPEAAGIAIARERCPQASFVQTTLERFPFEGTPHRFDCMYDYLYSLNTIEHVKHPKDFVRLMKRLKKFAVITTDNPGHKKQLGDFDRQHFTLDELRCLFRDYRTEPLSLSTPHIIGVKVYAK